MATTVQDPSGTRWTVRRSVLHGRDGEGRRLRWRGPDLEWLRALRLAEVADLADIPVLGVVALSFAAAVVVAVALAFLPFVALGLLEVLVLGVLLGGAAVAATTFGRPILVRAEHDAPANEAEGQIFIWAVRGWRSSRAVRDQVSAALRAGVDPRSAVGGDAEMIRAGRLPDPGH